jgi:hypothetical protein
MNYMTGYKFRALALFLLRYTSHSVRKSSSLL